MCRLLEMILFLIVMENCMGLNIAVCPAVVYVASLTASLALATEYIRDEK